MAFFSSHWHGKCVQVNILHGCVFNVTNTCRCQYIIHSEPNFPMFAFEVPSFVIFAVLCILHVAPPTRILRQKRVRRPFFAHFYDARGSSINDFHTHTWEISVKYLSLILALSLQLEVSRQTSFPYEHHIWRFLPLSQQLLLLLSNINNAVSPFARPFPDKWILMATGSIASHTLNTTRISLARNADDGIYLKEGASSATLNLKVLHLCHHQPPA